MMIAFTLVTVAGICFRYDSDDRNIYPCRCSQVSAVSLAWMMMVAFTLVIVPVMRPVTLRLVSVQMAVTRTTGKDSGTGETGLAQAARSVRLALVNN